MSEKVKLPKEVCNALDWVKKHGYLLPALTLGYEPEVTPEEQIKELYFSTIGNDSFYEGGKKYGIKKALQSHGFNYSWLEDDAE